MITDTDRIEKTIVLRAPRSRVWRALSDAKEFGSWFGVNIVGTFAPGANLRGQITHEGYRHLEWNVTIEKMEPERLFSFRWHPFAIDKNVDYSQEPTTLVVFRLEDAGKDTRLTVTESGFDALPAARRAQAFESNDRGWAQQMKSIEQHVSAAG